MDLGDREHIRQCLDGQPEAFRHLVNRYQGVVLSFLAGRLGDRDRAEDAAQETFVRGYFSLKNLKNPDSFFSWLLAIADRVAKDELRGQRRRRELIKKWQQEQPKPELSNNYALEKAVAALPEPYRQVVLLRYYGQMSCSQVAEQLQMSLGTVTKYLSRAYAILRDRLRQDQGKQEGSRVKP